jgi:hypothetical protein
MCARTDSIATKVFSAALLWPGTVCLDSAQALGNGAEFVPGGPDSESKTISYLCSFIPVIVQLLPGYVPTVCVDRAKSSPDRHDRLFKRSHAGNALGRQRSHGFFSNCNPRRQQRIYQRQCYNFQSYRSGYDFKQQL